MSSNKQLNNYRPDVQKGLNRINSQHAHDFIHPKNNDSKPLNNFDPNLIKKPQTPNLFNRPSSSHSNKNAYKPPLGQKPSTPDQFKMIHFDRMQRNYSNNNKGTKLIGKNIPDSYIGIYPSSVKHKNNYLGDARINNRPSTAPQKDKSNTKQVKQSNFIPNNPNKFLYGSLKRAPSPMIKSSNSYNLSRTQVVNRDNKYSYMHSPGMQQMNLRGGVKNRMNNF